MMSEVKFAITPLLVFLDTVATPTTAAKIVLEPPAKVRGAHSQARSLGETGSSQYRNMHKWQSDYRVQSCMTQNAKVADKQLLYPHTVANSLSL